MHVLNMRDALPEAAKRPPPLGVVGFIKTACNAWNTSRRYHSDAKPCRFGCGLEGGDSLDHYLRCCHVLHVVEQRFPVLLETSVPDLPCASLLGLARPMGKEAFGRHMLLLEALRSIHEDLRTHDKSCVDATELAQRICARFKAPSVASKWAKSRRAELLTGRL